MRLFRNFSAFAFLMINTSNCLAVSSQYTQNMNEQPILQASLVPSTAIPSTVIQLAEVKLDSSGIGGTGHSTTRTGGIAGTGNRINKTGGIGGTGKEHKAGPIAPPKKSPHLPDITGIPNVPDIPDVPIDTIPEIPEVHLPDGVDSIMSTGVFDGEVNIPDQ